MGRDPSVRPTCKDTLPQFHHLSSLIPPSSANNCKRVLAASHESANMIF